VITAQDRMTSFSGSVELEKDCQMLGNIYTVDLTLTSIGAVNTTAVSEFNLMFVNNLC
jgi:predicted acetyltransferase